MLITIFILDLKIVLLNNFCEAIKNNYDEQNPIIGNVYYTLIIVYYTINYIKYCTYTKS